MFTLDPVINPTQLVGLIDNVMQKMSETDPGTKEYGDMAAQLTQLYKALEIDTNVKTKVLDSYAKQNEIEFKMQQQTTETENKKMETDANLALKRAELDANRLFKAEEIALRIKEVDATAELRGAETELKKKEVEDRKRVSPDTVALIAANLAGILLIIGHERINVVTSKALGFVTRALK